ncbi:MAG: ATP-dependent metallopeptidase FtsH/Yme1/Tma family protein [Clostridiaceae bacterium]|nr:ATP-dependent metallopeptidase FtsH/Yme1/Tma family protein [Clostridiaceae bacterium]
MPSSTPNGKKPKDQRLKRSMLAYYLGLLLLVILINVLMDDGPEQIDYSRFVQLLEEDKVAVVQLVDDQIAVKLKDPADRTIYVTADVGDPQLTDRLLKSGVSFGGVIQKQMSPLLSTFLYMVLPFLLMSLLGGLLFRSVSKRMGPGNAMSFGKSNAKVYVEAQTGKTFADVAGQDEAKEALTELVDFLHDPEKYSKIGAQLPKGALLVGPPGTGKTLLAKAVAGEAGVPFFSISGSEFVEMFVGMGAARVRDLFKQAQEKAPCIVFIDEIDTIGKRRDNAVGGNDEREQTLNQLLSEMDGFDGSRGVIILAATNRPESLDPALLRPGRFDRRIPVELPDLQGREAILKVHARDIKAEPGVNWNVIARATAGASGAELANIVNEGALRAVRCQRNAVTQQDLEEAVETVIAGYQRKGAAVNEKEKQIVAYHEIGHALVAAMQRDSAPVHKITIVPRTSGALGYTMQVDEQERRLMSREEALAKISTLTGGRAAEELVFGSGSSGASNDIEQATKLARTMITRYGMSAHFDMMALETVTNQYLGGDSSFICSPETAYQADQEVLEIIKTCHARASEILSANIQKLHELAAYLLEKETITGEEFMAVMGRNSAAQ